jgi:hypothetical protein
MVGEVLEIFLKDGNPNEIYKIRVSTNTSAGFVKQNEGVFAYPLNPYIKSVPVIGEQVFLLQSISAFNTPSKSASTYYYISPVFIQRSLNTNPLPKTNKRGFINFNSGVYDNPIPITNNIFKKEGFSNGFEEITNLSQLQPFSGDIIFEGRFGQSIRFGYTPKNSGAKKNPNWGSTISNAPITIIRNTQNDTNKKGYDKFVVESISEDDSSIWMTSKQKVATKLASKSVISNISEYTNPQVIINSDRLIFNSRNDSVIVSAKKDIFFSTTKTKTSVDLIVEALEILANGTFPTAVGPTGPHPQLADILKKLKNI